MIPNVLVNGWCLQDFNLELCTPTVGIFDKSRVLNLNNCVGSRRHHGTSADANTASRQHFTQRLKPQVHFEKLVTRPRENEKGYKGYALCA
jgi:hypothetical protein